jgi:zinc protease
MKASPKPHRMPRAVPNLRSSASRRSSRFVLLLLWAVISGAAVSGLCQTLAPGGATSEFPRVQRIELLNGFRVFAVEKQAGRTLLNLLIKSGSAADPRTKEGVAFFTAWGILSANQKASPERWKDELDFLGAEVRVHVDVDATLFQAEVPSSNLEALLTHLVNAVLRPAFSEPGLERLRSEHSHSGKPSSDLQALGREYLPQLLFEGTPCGHSTQGGAGSAQALRVADLEEFHRAHYLPNNAALIIVGGPPASRLGTFVREKFGNWIKQELSPLELMSRYSLTSKVIRVIDRKGSDDALVVLGHPGPSRQTLDYLSLRAINELLDGIGPTSRLEKCFRSRNIRYQSLHAESQFGKTCGQFQIGARVTLDSLQLAIQALLDCIERLKSEPITETELELAKSRLLASHQASLESVAGLADHFTQMELHDLARDFLTAFPVRVERLSGERIQEAAKNYLSSSRIALVVAGDADRVKSLLGVLGPPELLDTGRPSPMPAATSR